MKYIILIGDGMSDLPIEELGGKTPLEHSATPNMDRLASCSELGLFKSVPEGYPPGSDVANLSILGYDPKEYYTGRAPLEAASIGVELSPTDVAFRCNLVTLKSSGDNTIMDDYSAGHITTEEGADIVKSLNKELSSFGVKFYPGKSYRHLMVWSGGKDTVECTPPHDISDKPIKNDLPRGDGSELINSIMKASEKVLAGHPVNNKRVIDQKKPATSIWLWGEGRAPSMPTFEEKFSVKGSIISAVDLMNGIGTLAGLEVISVPGVTGYIDTNYNGKAEYALRSLEEKDFICVHVEAPDEAGHQGSLADKITAIEDFDKLIVGPIIEGAKKFGDFRVLVLPDHPTPVELKTHTSDPVPFVLCSSNDCDRDTGLSFTENDAKGTGLVIEEASALTEKLFA